MEANTNSLPTAKIPAAIAAEIARVRRYLDGLEGRMEKHAASAQWSPAQAHEWAAEMDIRLRESVPVCEWFNPATIHGTTTVLDKLTRALVAQVFGLGVGFARLAPASTTRN